MQNSERCELIGRVFAYLDRHEDGIYRLREFLNDERGLWDTNDVMTYTGWGRTYIQSLVSRGVLPYIAGKPHKFIPHAVKKALDLMQQGGIYGKRKSKLKTKGAKV